MEKPLILITNDDGIHAPGLKHLVDAISSLGDLVICAPSGERSGSSLAITWAHPLHAQDFPWENGVKAWSLNGTPVDCVKLSLSSLLPRPPTLIVSGVNKGSNAGRTIFYSGTVGAVMEGAIRGVPGIAFSFCDITPPALGSMRDAIRSIVQYGLQHPMKQGSFLNVNFPRNCAQTMKGIKLARQGHGYWMERPEKRFHPEGTPYYWLGGTWSESMEESESDVALLEEGYATIVPLFIKNLTDFEDLSLRKNLFESLFSSPS